MSSPRCARLFRKDRHDLATLQASIVQIRKERHDLANQVMAASATKSNSSVPSPKYDQLRRQMDALQAAAQTPPPPLRPRMAANNGRDEDKTAIRRLEIENARLLTQIEALTSAAPPSLRPPPSARGDHERYARENPLHLRRIREALDRVPKSASNYVDVSFES